MMRGPQGGGFMPPNFGNMINGMFGGAQGAAGGAYQGAQNTINQYTQQGANYLNPFVQGGQNEIPYMGQYQQQFANTGNMFANPEQAYNQFMASYQMSPGAQFQLQQGNSAIQNALAQRGLTGSGHEGEALSQYTQGLINQDMNQQWNNMLQGGQFGLNAGNSALRAANDMYNGGLTAAGDAARLYGQAGEDDAELQEAQAQQQAAQNAQNSQNIWGLGGTLLGMASSGPGSLLGSALSWL